MPVIAAGVVVAALSGGPVDAHNGEVHLRSVIESVNPRTAYVAFDMIGEDVGLFVTVQPGVEFTLPGYQDEPYLRASTDGPMQVNVTSPTFFLNRDEFGSAPTPEEYANGATVTWLDLPDRSFAFHDHRVHWMSVTPPEEQGRVFDWEVPFTVDGVAHSLTGYLTTFDDEESSNGFGLGLIGFAIGVVLVGAVTALRARRGSDGAGPHDELDTIDDPSNRPTTSARARSSTSTPATKPSGRNRTRSSEAPSTATTKTTTPKSSSRASTKTSSKAPKSTDSSSSRKRQ